MASEKRVELTAMRRATRFRSAISTATALIPGLLLVLAVLCSYGLRNRSPW
jgi:hypothetical protein